MQVNTIKNLHNDSAKNELCFFWVTDNISSIYTSGRKCNFQGKGCEQDIFKPININGWFWTGAGNSRLPPTTDRSPTTFWSHTGPYVIMKLVHLSRARKVPAILVTKNWRAVFFASVYGFFQLFSDLFCIFFIEPKSPNPTTLKVSVPESLSRSVIQ